MTIGGITLSVYCPTERIDPDVLTDLLTAPTRTCRRPTLRVPPPLSLTLRGVYPEPVDGPLQPTK